MVWCCYRGVGHGGGAIAASGGAGDKVDAVAAVAADCSAAGLARATTLGFGFLAGGGVGSRLTNSEFGVRWGEGAPGLSLQRYGIS